jgi:hypothetical protein
MAEQNRIEAEDIFFTDIESVEDSVTPVEREMHDQ